MPRALTLAALAGVLYFVGFVGFEQLYLTWFCFVPVLLATCGPAARGAMRPLRVLLLGAVFGLVTNLGGYYWVVHLLEQFAGLPTSLAALGWVLLCFYQGFLLAIVIWLVHRARVRLGVAPVWSLPVAFAALEVAYPLLFPSFIGNSQYRFSAITQIVEVFGLPGLTALIALVNGAFYELLEARVERRPLAGRRVAIPAAAFATCLAYGLVRAPMVDRAAAEAPKLKVAIVQTNLGAADKHQHAEEFIRRHVLMSKQAVAAHPDIDLLVWPESAYNAWIARSDEDVSDEIGELGKPVIFGALTWDKGSDGKPRKYNTAVLAGADGKVLGLFDKVVLLMFGETLPLVEVFPGIRNWFKHSSVFERGKTFDHLKLDGATRLLPMICYEDIIPSFVREIWRTGGPAEVLVNITNDSWYGDTNEPLIHLALATFRSIETRRSLIRSTNTGISAVVDPAGRIARRTGQWTQETLIAEVPLFRDGSRTIYLLIGDALAWAALGLAGWGLWKSSRKVR